MEFKTLGLSGEVLEGLDAMGFSAPTPIQEKAIPTIINGGDLIGCAQTGTGKTAAFILPILHDLSLSGNRGKIDTVILAPTRELALQIDQQVQGLGYFCGIGSAPIYGGGDGGSWDVQKSALTTSAEIIIATPGRLIAHIQMGYVDLTTVKHLILDEADRMLDMGFYDDLMRIINEIPISRQSLLFSATMPPKIRKLAKEILNDPAEVNIAISKPSEKIVQAAFLTYDEQKLGLISHLLSAKTMSSVIIFCSRKVTVDKVVRELNKHDIPAEGIHSDLDQSKREDILRDFKNRKLNVLIATDILSRGIDVEDIDLVINYDVPQDAADYVHRIGRTARAQSDGVAFTFINPDDQYNFHNIEELIEKEVRKVALPGHLGDGPEWNPLTKKSSKGKRRKPYKKANR
ncbi:MAG: DEAD/DEAH box helicase [Bacteroidota bacterium]